MRSASHFEFETLALCKDNVSALNIKYWEPIVFRCINLFWSSKQTPWHQLIFIVILLIINYYFNNIINSNSIDNKAIQIQHLFMITYSIAACAGKSLDKHHLCSNIVCITFLLQNSPWKLHFVDLQKNVEKRSHKARIKPDSLIFFIWKRSLKLGSFKNDVTRSRTIFEPPSSHCRPFY